MKRIAFILISTLLLAGCDTNSSDIVTSTSLNSGLSDTTTSILDSSNDETLSSSENQSSYTYETIIKYISEQLFGTSGKYYSYDKEYDKYYTTLIFEDNQALTKEDGLTYLIALSNLPSEFICVESNVLDTYDDGTPLIYSTYKSGNLAVEFQTYEVLDDSNNVVAVNGQITAYYE
ncbi:MAG TPA: hypothetical protein DDW20_03670 [Firmicutes bacterium]|nr:hypothetical protein [Bacillota bacterium]